MRISDWSSDVCSSDLGRISADGEYSPWRKVKDEPRVLAMSDGEGVIFALERPDIQGNARYSLIEASADKGGSKLHIMRDDNNKPLNGIDGTALHNIESKRRSEEHTSELQSLMRISYAVFCMNKKSKHNNKPLTKYHKNT